MTIENLKNKNITSKSREIWKYFYGGLKILAPSLLVIVFPFRPMIAWWLSFALMVFCVLWKCLVPKNFQIPLSRVNESRVFVSLSLVQFLSLGIAIASHPFTSSVYQNGTKGIWEVFKYIFSIW